MRFREFLLLEYNEDKNWANHGAKITERLKSQGVQSNHREFWDKQIKDHDHTPNKEYASWISQKYASGGINHHEDIGSRVAPALDIYHKHKLKKTLESHGVSKDIGAIKNITHLEDSVDRLPKIEEKSKDVSDGEVTKHDEEHWKVYTPHTEEAAKKYGAGTRWCTAARGHNMFDNYNSRGPLHIYVPKNPKYTGEKYQGHRETFSFMDEKDRSANSDNIFKDRPSPHAKKHIEISPEYIHDTIKRDDQTEVLNRHLFDHPNFNKDHITQLLTTHHNHFDGYQATQSNIMSSKHFSADEHLPIAIKHWSKNIRRSSFNRADVKPEHIDYALDHDHDEIVKRNAVMNPNATSKHLDKGLQDKNTEVRQGVLLNPKATSKHISQGLSDSDALVRQTAIQHPNATSEHITKALNDKNPYVRAAAANHPKITASHITKALDDNDEQVRENAIKSRKFNHTHLTKVLNSGEEGHHDKYVALHYGNPTSAHLMKALDDSDIKVQRTAIQHKNAGAEHFTKALSSDNEDLQYMTVRRGGLTPEHINKALDSKYSDVRRLAAQHINATPENLMKAMSDPDEHVRIHALRHQHSTIEHINKGLADSNSQVQGHAAYMKKYKED